MTLCPIAVVAGCRKCPVFSVCPLKTVIGDYKPPTEEPPQPPQPAAKAAGKRSTQPARKR